MKEWFKKGKRRFMAYFLVFVMIFGSLPINVAASGSEVNFVTRDITEYERARQDLIAIQGDVSKLAATMASDSLFILSSNSETAQFVDGVLTFTDEGIIEITPHEPCCIDYPNCNCNEAETLTLTQQYFDINNTNLAQFSVVGGTATGEITLQLTSPTSIYVVLNQSDGVVIVQGRRLAYGEPGIHETFSIIVSRGNASATIAVTVNLTPLTPPQSPPQPPPQPPTYTPSTGGPAPLPAPAPRPTIPANDGAVDVHFRVANNRITLELPTTRVNQLINTAVDYTVIFDSSDIENVTTAVLSRAALRRFVSEGLALRIYSMHGVIVFDTEALSELAEQARTSNISIDLEPLEQDDDLPPVEETHLDEEEPKLPPPPQHVLRFEIGQTQYTHHGMIRISDAAPFITYDRAMVPLRIIAEALGADVYWHGETRTATINRNGVSLTLAIDVPLPDGMGMPVIINDRTFVPTRYVSEMLGAYVRWDSENRAVYVYPH